MALTRQRNNRGIIVGRCGDRVISIPSDCVSSKLITDGSIILLSPVPTSLRKSPPNPEAFGSLAAGVKSPEHTKAPDDLAVAEYFLRFNIGDHASVSVHNPSIKCQCIIALVFRIILHSVLLGPGFCSQFKSNKFSYSLLQNLGNVQDSNPTIRVGGNTKILRHTSRVLSVNKHLNQSTYLAASGSKLCYILGEVNSLYGQGAPGLSNSFAAALWGVDFNLYCAATGISRAQMHQGTIQRYVSWQPIQMENTTLRTKAPYYGNIAVATFLGDLTAGNVSIADMELGDIYKNSYAAYVDDRLERIAAIQLHAYNYTGGAGPTPSENFTFKLPQDCGAKMVSVQRLVANGNDAITGITFDGCSYNYELEQGKSLPLRNVTRREELQVGRDGSINFDVPWSSAVILKLQW